MPSLAEIQQDFARALRDSDLAVPGAVRRNPSAVSSRRFDVYRNNMAVSLVEALQSTFPAVRRLVGEEYFGAAARAYVDRHPPASPVLLLYGERFGEFLDALPSASRVPYLGDVARLEWARVDALHSTDAEPVGIERLGEVSESAMNEVTFTLHPSLSVMASPWPVVSLWQASVDPDVFGDVDIKQAERAMVVRPALRVLVHRLPPGGDVFLSSLQAGEFLGSAAERAVSSVEAFDLPGCLQLVFQSGVVVVVNPPPEQQKIS